MREYPLGSFVGLKITALTVFVPASLGIWLVTTLIALLLNLAVGEAIVAGFACTALYWLSELNHQLGHAWAARRTGHPMIGIRFGTLLIFSTSVYPLDEPPLPAAIHIRRALGGPLFSACLSGFLFIVLALANPVVAWPGQFILWFVLVENLIITVQVFVPVGFNDGATIWHYVRQR
jgi:hypothetical protein